MKISIDKQQKRIYPKVYSFEEMKQETGLYELEGYASYIWNIDGKTLINIGNNISMLYNPLWDKYNFRKCQPGETKINITIES